MTESPDQDSLFARIGGGEQTLRQLVDGFYDRMDQDPAYAQLRAAHPPRLDGSRDKLFWYLCGWTGGAAHYTDRFGHPRLRARHLPFAISSVERDQWLHCMHAASAELPGVAAVRDELLAALAPLADWMRNRPDDR